MKANMSGVNIRTPEEPSPKKRNKELAIVKEKGKGKLEIHLPSGRSSLADDQGKKIHSSKQSVIINKGKEKLIESPKKLSDIWESMPARYHNKGIKIGSPPRSPLLVYEDAMISTKSKPKTPTEVRTEIKKPRRRNRQQNIVAPSCGKMICPQDVVDSGLHLNPATKPHSVWFILTPSLNQKRKDTLQLLLEPYVQIIMDGNCHPDVSILMKYIALQLKHCIQEEVGIFMNGKLLLPKMKLLDVVKQWMGIVGSERKITKIASSAEQFCVKLTYALRE